MKVVRERQVKKKVKKGTWLSFAGEFEVQQVDPHYADVGSPSLGRRFSFFCPGLCGSRFLLVIGTSSHAL